MVLRLLSHHGPGRGPRPRDQGCRDLSAFPAEVSVNIPAIRLDSIGSWTTSARTTRPRGNCPAACDGASASTGTPTTSSWLNLLESYFAVLERTALYNTDCRSPAGISEGSGKGMRPLNASPRPYLWKKILGDVSVPTRPTRSSERSTSSERRRGLSDFGYGHSAGRFAPAPLSQSPNLRCEGRRARGEMGRGSLLKKDSRRNPRR